MKEVQPYSWRALGPGDEVEGHGVGDGAVAVEEVGLEVAFGEREGHRF